MSNAVVVERSSPVSLATVHFTQPTAVAVATGVVTQAQATASPQMLTHASAPMAQAVVLPYPLPQAAQHGPGQLQAGAFIPAAYNYVRKTGGGGGGGYLLYYWWSWWWWWIFCCCHGGGGHDGGGGL